MKLIFQAVAVILLLSPVVLAQSSTIDEPKIKAKHSSDSVNTFNESSLLPDSDLIDAPTAAVLDDHGYSSRSRFYSQGGLLQYFSFGVYPGVNLGASAAVDHLIGDDKNVRLRAPSMQIKYRFYAGDQNIPAFAIGYDGQGYRYNTGSKRFNQRQRGFYLVATKELGAPGLQIHPSFNISDFNTNAIFGSLPFSFNIRDKVEIVLEWDNIANFHDSRLNAGIKAYLMSNFHVDFAVRAIGAGGFYSDGARRGPERIVQLKYSSSF